MRDWQLAKKKERIEERKKQDKMIEEWTKEADKIENRKE